MHMKKKNFNDILFFILLILIKVQKKYNLTIYYYLFLYSIKEIIKYIKLKMKLYYKSI